jgi:hypothetical protein
MSAGVHLSLHVAFMFLTDSHVASWIVLVWTTQMLVVSCFVTNWGSYRLTAVTVIWQFFVDLSTRTAFRDSFWLLVTFYQLCQVASALHFLALSDKFISYCTVYFMVNFLLLHVEFYIDCRFRIVSLFYITACCCIACRMTCSQSYTVCACWVVSLSDRSAILFRASGSQQLVCQRHALLQHPDSLSTCNNRRPGLPEGIQLQKDAILCRPPVSIDVGPSASCRPHDPGCRRQ